MFSISICSAFQQIAGNAVKKASDNLVRAAQKAAFDKADEDSVVVKTKFVGGIAQVTPSNSTKVFVTCKKFGISVFWLHTYLIYYIYVSLVDLFWTENE